MRRTAGMLVVASVVACGPLLSPAGTAYAGPPCERRSAAHTAQHGGLEADSAWHVRNGELPTCNGDNEGEDQQPQLDDVQKPQWNYNRGNDEQPQEKKSRFCRRHWWC